MPVPDLYVAFRLTEPTVIAIAGVPPVVVTVVASLMLTVNEMSCPGP